MPDRLIFIYLEWQLQGAGIDYHFAVQTRKRTVEGIVMMVYHLKDVGAQPARSTRVAVEVPREHMAYGVDRSLSSLEESRRD